MTIDRTPGRRNGKEGGKVKYIMLGMEQSVAWLVGKTVHVGRMGEGKRRNTEFVR